MGGDHGAPTLRRDLFDSDEEYAAAQRAVDDDELSRLASRGDVEADMPEPYRATAISPDTEPAATHVVQDGADVPPTNSENRTVGYECVSTGRSRWSPHH